MDSFNVNMNELQMFIFGNKYYENETEEEKKYRKEETKKKIQNEFLLKDMKKKVFFLKNIIDYIYPKVIVGKLNSEDYCAIISYHDNVLRFSTNKGTSLQKVMNCAE